MTKLRNQLSRYSVTQILNLKIIILIFFSTIAVSLLQLTVFAQSNSPKWLYFGTDAEFNRHYLRNIYDKSEGGFIRGWIKIISPEDVYTERMYNWDCKKRSMQLLYVAVYYPDNTLALKQDKPDEWSQVVPDTLGDKMLDYICGIKRDVYWAEITSTKANLRIFAGTEHKVLRVARKGEKFRVISSLENKIWYNVIDEETQKDFWIHYSTIKIYKE
jgi:hypothetical protein